MLDPKSPRKFDCSSSRACAFRAPAWMSVALLPLLFAACRSTPAADPEDLGAATAQALPEDAARSEWLAAQEARGLSPATLFLAASLWGSPLAQWTRSLPPAQAIPEGLTLETLDLGTPFVAICDGYRFRAHVAPHEGLFWLEPQGGIAGWVELFGPAPCSESILLPGPRTNRPPSVSDLQ